LTRLWHEYSNRYSNAAGVQQPSPPQRLVEPVCRLAAQAGTDVAVDVCGDRVRRVAQVFLDDLGVRAGSEQEAGSRVPEGVQMHALEAGPFREELEPPQYVARLQRRPNLSVVKTRPVSRHVLAAVCRSASCRTRCAVSVSTAEPGRGTVLRDLSVFGSPSSSPREVRVSVQRTRSAPASRSTSAQCRPRPRHGAALWPG